MFYRTDLSKLKKCDHEIDRDRIIINEQLKANKAYHIFLTGKRSLISSFLSVDSSNDNLEESGVALGWLCPLVSDFTKGEKGIKIYYSKMSNKNKTKDWGKKAVKKINNDAFDDQNQTIKSKTVVPDTTNSINFKYKLMKTLLPIFEIKSADDIKIWNLIFAYNLYTDTISDSEIASGGIETDSDAGEQKVYNNYHTEFDPYTDELPFGNFASEYGTTGNCVGIAHLTSTLYNTGSYTVAGEKDGIKYDLSADQDNATLTDPGLSDYKDSEFVTSHTKAGGTLSDLSKGEEEFVKMIGAAFVEGNERVDLNDYAVGAEKNSYELAQKMMDELDQGKVLDVYLLMRNGTGHAINIYDYYFIDDDNFIFRVYDCNIPKGDNIDSRTSGACYLQCRSIVRPDGSKGFDYIYYPLKGHTDYVSTSDTVMMPTSSIVAVGEDWKILN